MNYFVLFILMITIRQDKLNLICSNQLFIVTTCMDFLTFSALQINTVNSTLAQTLPLQALQLDGGAGAAWQYTIVSDNRLAFLIEVDSIL